MPDGTIKLLECWKIFVKNKNFVFLISVTMTLVSIVVSLILPKIYNAECALMSVGGHVGSGGMEVMTQLGLGQLGGLVGVKEGDGSNKLLVIMQSKTLAERVIKKLDLMSVLYPASDANKLRKTPTLVEAIDKLQDHVKVLEDKKSRLITVEVLMNHPEDAARIANGYLDELANYINENTFTAAKRNRIFIEKQLERNKAELLSSGKELASFYETNNISNVVPSLDVDVSLHKEEGLPVNDEQGMLDNKTAQLQNELETTSAKLQHVNVVKDVPQQIYLQYLIIQRELLGRLNVLLSQQYEMAKVDEAKEDIGFQVIDRARVPVQKFKPKRRQIVMTSFVVSIFLGIFYAFFREYLEKMRSNPEEKILV